MKIHFFLNLFSPPLYSFQLCICMKMLGFIILVEGTAVLPDEKKGLDTSPKTPRTQNTRTSNGPWTEHAKTANSFYCWLARIPHSNGKSGRKNRPNASNDDGAKTTSATVVRLSQPPFLRSTPFDNTGIHTTSRPTTPKSPLANILNTWALELSCLWGEREERRILRHMRAFHQGILCP